MIGTTIFTYFYFCFLILTPITYVQYSKFQIDTLTKFPKPGPQTHLERDLILERLDQAVITSITKGTYGF
jgi:hypothetical protein